MTPEVAKMLRDAAKQIEVVTAELDRTVNTCECCTAPRWQNRTEYQMGIELDALVTKLNRFATQLIAEENAKAKAAWEQLDAPKPAAKPDNAADMWNRMSRENRLEWLAQFRGASGFWDDAYADLPRAIQARFMRQYFPAKKTVTP